MTNRWTRLAVLAATVAAYFVAGKLGLSLAYVNESTSAVWPPAGIAVAALLVLGSSAWPAIALGAFLVNVTTSESVAASIVIAAGNTLEALTAAALATRFARGRDAFQRTPDILRFVVGAALVATTIAASIGTAALIGAGLASAADAGSIWLTWWLGDAVGTVVVGPLILVWLAPVSRWQPARVAEAVALAVCVIAASFVVFGESPLGQRGLPLAYVMVPILLWPAFRFGVRETATAAATMAIIALRGTVAGLGPFAESSPNESLLLLQGFVGAMTIVMLSVAAEVMTRRAVEMQVRSLNQALEERVVARTEELSKVHSRLLEAQQVAHVGSWDWDVRTNTLWWSEELCRIYGVGDYGPPTYERYISLVHPEDRSVTEEIVRRAMHDLQPFAFEHRIVRPDGSVRALQAQGRVIAGQDGRPIRMMGTGHDITERRAAEVQRAQLMLEQAARREAEQANQAKDQFLATLSHELRTPLNAALGWAQILRTARGDDERRERASDAIYRNLLIQARLVSDILDVSRITHGALRLEAGAVDVRVLLDSAVDTLRDTAEARRISVRTLLPAALPTIAGDGRRLEQIVWNLLSNALKFAPEGGTVTLQVAIDDDAVEIAVADDGPGIDPAFLPHVFEPFRQADASTTREHGGLGLGLAIARHLVQLHGGTIAAANREQGAVFTVRLPIVAAGANRDAGSGMRDSFVG